MVGLSARTLMINAFFQIIILLYLMDNDTSWMILFSSSLGLVIELWKITKALSVSSSSSFPFLSIASRHKDQESDTAKYDRLAMRYLSTIVFPLVIGYALYV